MDSGMVLCNKDVTKKKVCIFFSLSPVLFHRARGVVGVGGCGSTSLFTDPSSFSFIGYTVCKRNHQAVHICADITYSPCDGWWAIALLNPEIGIGRTVRNLPAIRTITPNACSSSNIAFSQTDEASFRLGY